MTMRRLMCSKARHEALNAVYGDHVRYHNGLAGPALCFTWAEESGGQMFHEMRDTLHELWAADFIDVETHRLFAQRGHRVHVTMRGYQRLCEWRHQHPANTEPRDRELAVQGAR